MFCQKCGTENNDSAVYCQKCGMKLNGEIENQTQIDTIIQKQQAQIKSNNGIIGVIIFVILGILTIGGISSPNSSSNSVSSGSSVGISEAKVIAENAIKNSLKNPPSAKFRNVSCSELSTSVFMVTGIVNATNSFGGAIDTPFTIKIQYNGGDWSYDNNWSVLSVEME